uniref:hypothetical protein n=1 Tax=Streptomyces sp. CA-136453 TaxID=3240050 RepID=UPI003F49AAE8
MLNQREHSVIPPRAGAIGLRLRTADIPTTHALESLAQLPVSTTDIARRARFALSTSVTAHQRCAEQAREVMSLLLPELEPTDSLVDWAAVTIGELVQQALGEAVAGKLACELRVDGEHLYVSVETASAGPSLRQGADRGLLDAISSDTGAYTSADGYGVKWAATEIVPT